MTKDTGKTNSARYISPLIFYKKQYLRVNNVDCCPRGILRISSDGDDRMGARVKTPKKFPGASNKTLEILLTKNLPSKKLTR